MGLFCWPLTIFKYNDLIIFVLQEATCILASHVLFILQKEFSMKKEVLAGIQDQIRGMIPNRFKLVVISNGHKSVAVRINLGEYRHRQAIAARLRSSEVDGACFEGNVLVIAGTKNNILERVRVCKEQVLLHQAS